MGWIKEILNEIEPYRPGKRASEVERELGLTDVAKLSSNESAYPPFKEAIRAMRTVLDDLQLYPDGNCGALKDKLAEKLDRPAGRIMVGNGSNELIRLLAAVLLEPGDEVIMAAPSFIVYPLVTKVHGGVSVEVPLKNLTHDLEAMAAALTPRTKLVFVCNPNNPTGTIVPSGELKEFIEAVPEDVCICVDEAYHEFVEADDYETALKLQDGRPNVVVMRTFSKIYGLAGARIGYGVAEPRVVEAVNKVREPFNVNTVAQAGALSSLDCDAEVVRRCRQNAAARDYVQEGLDAMGLVRSESQANFVYFNAGRPAAEAFEQLQRRGVIVRALGAGDFIRATLGTRQQNEKMLSALRSTAASG